jgi:hypothetical protein
MDRKEATMLAMIAITLLATILTMTAPTSAFALGHWNIDEDFVPATGMANSDTEDSETANTDDEEEGSDEDSETANTDDEEEGSDEDSETANTDDEEEGSDEDSETANTDDEEEGSDEAGENSGDTDNPDGNEDPSQVAYENLQACLSDSSGEGLPSEQEVQDCIDSSYGGNDGAENAPADSTDEVEESGDGVTEEVSSDDSFDDEEN